MSANTLSRLISKTVSRIGKLRRLELQGQYGTCGRREFSSLTDEENSKWKNWFRSHEYQPIWTPSPVSKLCNKDQLDRLSDSALDNASKCLVLQLDDITYCIQDFNRRLDVPTTAECNCMMKRLNAFMNERKEFSTASYRSYIIWKKMEHCVDIRRDFRHNSVKSQYHYSLPVPNRDTYMEVLSSQAQGDSSGIRIDAAQERAMNIARKMEERYDEGHWDARPDVAVWNQVLASWAHSSHPEKSFEAAKLLKMKIGQNADASSFGNVFKACATTEGDARALELAGRVALRVWDDLKTSPLISPQSSPDHEHALERGSYMIVFALKSLQLLGDGATRDEIIKSQFDTACRLGLVNSHVLLALKSVASDKVLKVLLGKHIANEAEAIYHLIPSSWKVNAKANALGW